MNIMKKNEREPNKNLLIFGWVMLIFYILFIIYLDEINEALNTFHIHLPTTIIFDLPVLYVICLITYYHIKHRDNR